MMKNKSPKAQSADPIAFISVSFFWSYIDSDESEDCQSGEENDEDRSGNPDQDVVEDVIRDILQCFENRRFRHIESEDDHKNKPDD